MRNYIIIARTTACLDSAKDNQVIITEDLVNTAKELEEERIKFEFFSNKKSAYSDSFTAIHHSSNLYVDGVKYNFRSNSLKKLDRIKLQYSLALHGLDIAHARNMLINELMRLVPSVMPLSKAINIINSVEKSKRASTLIAHKLEQKITKRNDDFISHVSISKHNKHVEYTDYEYNQDLVEFIIKNPESIHILNGGMGKGKTTEIMIPAYDIFCRDGHHPVYCTPRRSLSCSISTPEHYDQYVRHHQEKAPGVIGVVNTLYSNAFSSFIDKSDALLIDEFELNESHLISNAIGDGKLSERVALSAKILKHMKSSKYVIVSDALFSEYSANKIHRVTKKNIYVHNGGNIKKEVSVSICDNELNLGFALKNLSKGSRVAIFSDAPHNSNKSTFNGIYHAVSTSSPSIKIDGVLAKNDNNFFMNINNEIKSYQAAIISPVISSGVSLTDHFKDVHFIGYQTIDPLQLVQSLMRVRDVERITVSIMHSLRKHPLSKTMILSNELQKELSSKELTDNVFRKHESNQGVAEIIDRISYENSLLNDYENAVVVILEYLGFSITYKDGNKSVRQAGYKALKMGKAYEDTHRTKEIISKNNIEESKKTKAYFKGNKKIEAHHKIAHDEILKFYLKDKVDYELVEFDDKGKGRKIVQNYLYLNSKESEHQLAEKVIANEFINMIADHIRLNDRVYSQKNAESLHDFIENGFVTVNDTSAPAKDILRKILPEVKFTKQPGTLVKNILKHAFHLDVSHGPRLQMGAERLRTYEILETSKSEKAQSLSRHIKERTVNQHKS